MGAYDVAIAGGVEHMGRHPMGEGVDPNPRILAEKLVDPSALVMGATAENLHDRLPGDHQGAGRRVRLASQQKTAAAYAGRQAAGRPVRVATRDPETGWGLATVDEAPRRHHLEKLGHAQDPVPPARQGDRRQRGGPQRRRHAAVLAAEDVAGNSGSPSRCGWCQLRVRRRRAGGHGRRSDPVHREGARARPPWIYRTSACSN